MRQAVLFFFCLSLPCSLFYAVQAQSPYFRKYSMPQEFVNERVNLIFQDSQHFIWLGTTRGLLRFNGTSFEHFEHGTKGEEVTALYEDIQGVLWIGYDSGKIRRLKKGKFLPYNPEEGFPKVKITAFAEDTTGALWLATYGEGVYLTKNKRTYNINEDDGLADNYVYDIQGDSKGNMWLGTDGGLVSCRFEDGEKLIQIIDGSKGLPDNIVTSVNVDNQGQVWIGMEAKGIGLFDVHTNEFRLLLDNWKYGRVNDIQLFKNKAWVGTSQGKLIEVDIENREIKENVHTGLEMIRISDMETDSLGNMWIANETSEFYYTHPAFTFLRESGGKTISDVQAILHLRNDDIWYSNGNGVFCYSFTTKQLVEKHLEQTSFRGPNVISMFEDLYGQVWLGTFDQGIYITDPTTGESINIREEDGLVNNNVLSIAGVGNSIWLATLGGVSKITLRDPGSRKRFISQIQNFTSENGLGSNFIYQVFVDSKKRVWFATDGRGVTVLEDENFINFSTDKGLTSKVIYSITEDAKGNIWVSSANQGLYKYENNRFKKYLSKNGIRDLSIASIIGDKKGNILLLSKEGIDILNPDVDLVYYHGEEMGISDIDPNLNAYSVDATGNIWMGTQSGIIKYNGDFAHKQQKPITRINKVLIFLNELETENFYELSSDQNHISFDYIGFWYPDPQEVIYQVKLEGYDREWINSKNKFITYPNLPPGNYNFKVRSSVTSTFEDADIISYSFLINPPFYNTIWFYTLCLLAVGGLMFLFIKQRENKLRISERQKKEQIEFQFNTLKSQVNPHFLFNSFNTLVAVIEEDPPTAVEYVEKLSDFYRNILLHREKDVILLYEELQMIGDYYFLQLKRYRDNFVLGIQVPEAFLQMKVPPLAVQLLVENAIKHNIIAKEKPLVVEIFVDNGFLIIKNNLQRKPQHEPSTGLGLKNIVERYRLLTEKEVQVEEQAKHFIVKLPLLT